MDYTLPKRRTEVKGTILNYVVKDGVPQCGDGDHPNKGQVQAFNIIVDEFNASRRRQVCFLHRSATLFKVLIVDNFTERFSIGLAGSAQGIGPNAGPCAIFTPEPNAGYQIQPSSKFYIAFGDFREGEIIDCVKKSKNACMVDFTKLDHAGTTEVMINHDTDNILTIQADP
ncbi:hypothetical protein COCMIDRAFT_3637 [Bipolaris oryzae ATCC 44560]|uniref:Uncharacterized protein n=1 Tax=Bipolaris oryzae ATCC 44560 TaxID=930090 RepID=W6ZUG2_COCMI|nr:uncharacterized protein COCMIDRAFT_3637 [Bipolaris oryzae ATCC 44560]EUC47381.1 hypothetical protein COCMIDRAFT_3637 [Bipolaris oryzae ATCC 44560]